MTYLQQLNKHWMSVFTGCIGAGILYAFAYGFGEDVPASAKLYTILFLIIIPFGYAINFLIRAAFTKLSWINRLGITNVYQNFESCEKIILHEMSKSENTKIFVQIGKTVLSGRGTLYDRLYEKSAGRNVNIKVLHASIDNPYLSERRAKQRKSDYDGWFNDLRYAETKLSLISHRSNSSAEVRQHKEGFVWRLFIFDDVAFVQPYMFAKNNSSMAPVVQIKNKNRNKPLEYSLYNVFEKYFDLKWEENKPETTSSDTMRSEGTTIAVAARITIDDLYLFVIPDRYIRAKGSQTLPFHGVGGKCNTAEDLVVALKREAREEIGIEIDVQSSPSTRYWTTGANLSDIRLLDEVKPFCIYKKTDKSDPNFSKADVGYLFGFDAMPIGSTDIKPQQECGAILLLSSNLLMRSLKGELSFRDIQLARDGSKVIVKEGTSINPTLLAQPKGLAMVIAANVASHR